MSSTLYCYVNAKKLLNKKTFKFNCRERIRQCIWKVKYRASRYLKLFSCNKLICSCKNEARVANYCNYKLRRDEKNPGSPTCVDPNKTIVAPYSQGKELVFWTECRTTMCYNKFVFFYLQWHTRDQLSKWSYTNNEYWKSALFKFVMISQTGIFDTVRITNSIKCVWYWLSTAIQWKLLWYCSPRNCYRKISVLYIVIYLFVLNLTKKHEYESNLHINEHYLSSSGKKAWKKFRPVRDLNP